MSDILDSLPKYYWLSWKSKLRSMQASGLGLVALGALFAFTEEWSRVAWRLTFVLLALLFLGHLIELVRLRKSSQAGLILSAKGCEVGGGTKDVQRLAWTEVLPAHAVQVKDHVAPEDFYSPLYRWLFRVKADWEITLRYPKPGTGNRFRGEDLGSVSVSAKGIDADADTVVQAINRVRAHALRHEACPLPELLHGAGDDAVQQYARKRWFVEHTLPNDPWDAKTFREELGPHTIEVLDEQKNLKLYSYESIGGRVIVRPGKLVVSAELV